MKKYFLPFVLAALLLGTTVSHAQIAMPQPSPAATVTQKVGMADVSVSYSCPSARGPEDFADLLPLRPTLAHRCQCSHQTYFQ